MNSLKPLLALVSSAAVLFSATAASGATLYSATRLPGYIPNMAHVGASGYLYLQSGFTLTDQSQAFYEVYTPSTSSGLGRWAYAWDADQGSNVLDPTRTPLNFVLPAFYSQPPATHLTLPSTRIIGVHPNGSVLFTQNNSRATFLFDINTQEYWVMEPSGHGQLAMNLHDGSRASFNLAEYQSPGVDPRLFPMSMYDQWSTNTHYYGLNSTQMVGRMGWTATLWEDGQAYDLNTLAGFSGTTFHPLFGTTDYRLRAATAINAHGQILAIASGGMHTGTSGDIYLLTPKGPEPKIEEITTTTPIPDHGINPLFWLVGIVVGSWLKWRGKLSVSGKI